VIRTPARGAGTAGFAGSGRGAGSWEDNGGRGPDGDLVAGVDRAGLAADCPPDAAGFGLDLDAGFDPPF
jgi:hypothetical protein